MSLEMHGSKRTSNYSKVFAGIFRKVENARV